MYVILFRIYIKFNTRAHFRARPVEGHFTFFRRNSWCFFVQAPPVGADGTPIDTDFKAIKYLFDKNYEPALKYFRQRNWGDTPEKACASLAFYRWKYAFSNMRLENLVVRTRSYALISNHPRTSH